MHSSRSPKYIWHQVPLFRLIWPFVFGIIVGIFLPSLFWSYATLALLVLIFILLTAFRNRPIVQTVLMLLMFCGFGYVITVFNTDRLFENHFTTSDLRQSTIIGVIVSDPIPRTKSIKAEIDVQILVNDRDTQLTQGKLLGYIQKDSIAYTLGIGDTVAISGWINEVSEPQNPNEFNYKRYLGFHQITHQVYADSISWNRIGVGRGIKRLIKDWQHSVLTILSDFGLMRDELAIVSALLVGYKHYLSADQVNAFASAGAMHVLAVSGLHVGIIYLILSRLLIPIERIRYGGYIVGVALIVGLWLYAAITGFSPSVTRAATMFSFVVAAKQFRRNTDIFNTLASSAMLLLFLNPFLLVEVGFQLSYLAVLGIVILQPRIVDLWQPPNWFLKQVWGISAVSIAAQVATFPLGLLYFHQFPSYFLLSNLVVIPAATVILPLGISLIAFHWVPYLAEGIAFVLSLIVHWLNRFIDLVQHIPAAQILGIDISIFETYFIYMIIVTSVGFLIQRKYSWLLYFLASILVIEGYNIWELNTQQNQKAIVIYNVRGHHAIDFISGLDHTFMADSSLIGDFDKMRFHIHHHWWHRDLNAPKVKSFRSSSLKFQNHSILILDSNKAVVDDLANPDLLYIAERTAIHPKEVLNNTRPSLVILSPNIDWKSKGYWKRLLQDQEIAYHDMHEVGAYTAILE